MITSALTCAVAAFISAVIATPVARGVGRRIGLVDRPDNYRKIHHREIPFTGGYAVLTAFAVTLSAAFYGNWEPVTTILRNDEQLLIGLLVSAFVVLLMGTADDLWNLSPRQKLLCQLIVASGAWFAGFSITSISNPFGSSAIMLGWWSYPITVFWFLSCMNAINLVDGLDGLAAGVGLFASITMAVVGVLSDNAIGMIMSASLSGAVLGFLIFNFNPASIFLGDCGSMVLGFLIAAISLMGSLKAGTAVALVTPVIALGLPAFDTALAITRRWSTNMPIMSADGRHVHHVLMSVGLSQRTVVLLMYGVCIALGISALLLTAGNNQAAVLFLTILLILAFVFIRVFNIVNIRDIQQRLSSDAAERRRASQAVTAVQQAVVAIARADDSAAAWDATGNALESLGMTEAVLEMTDDGRLRSCGPLTWKTARLTTRSTALYTAEWSLILPLLVDEQWYGSLMLRCQGDVPPVAEAVTLAQRLRVALANYAANEKDTRREQPAEH